MAPLPRKLGVEAILEDIALGIGRAARILPEKSRSAVGAVAVKGARVSLQFEMSVASSSRGVGVGIGDGFRLGMKSLAFGVGMTQSAVEERQVNRANIDLEIVAIPVAEPTAEVPTPDLPIADEKLEAAFASARAVAATMRLDRAQLQEFDRLMAAGLAALKRGDRATAAAALEAMAAILQAAKDEGG